MAKIATTKLSSKGQIVIPEDIRDKMGLQAGDQFVVLAEKGVVILKMISPPSLDEFEHLVKEARTSARKAKLKKGDLKAIIRKTRNAG